MFKVMWRNEFDGDMDDKCFMVLWDYNDEEIDDIMDKELQLPRYTGTHKKNMLWLKQIKEMTGLKETMYISTKQNCDGCFYVWINNWEYPLHPQYMLDDLTNAPFCDFKLEEDGSVYMNVYEDNVDWVKIETQ